MRIFDRVEAHAILACAEACDKCGLLRELGYTHKCGESGVWFEERFCSSFIAMKLAQLRLSLQQRDTAVDIVFTPEIEAEINNQIILGALHEYVASLERNRDASEGSVRDFIERKRLRCLKLIESYEQRKKEG